MRPLILLLFLISLSLQLTGQKYYFRQYSSNEGLMSPYVYDIVQDDQGFIWIGTPDGLCRFNGFDFESFTVAEGISENFTTKIYKDSKGRLWLGHNNGTVSLLLKNGVKTFFKEYELSGAVTDIGEDDLGSIWVAIQNQGIILIHEDYSSSTPTCTPNHELLLSQFEFLGDNRMIIGSQESLFIAQYNRIESSLELIQEVETFPMAQVMDIIPDKKEGYVIITQNSGVFHLDPDVSEESQLVSIIDENSDGVLDNLYGGILDLNGDLWVNSMGNGVIQFTENTKSGYTRLAQLNELNGLHSENIRSVFEDLEGNLWLGAFGEGLLRYVDANLRFRHPDTNTGQTVEAHALTGIENSILIKSGNSLLGVSLNSDSVIFSIPLPHDPSVDRVNAIHISKDGRIWLGYEQSGVYLAGSVESPFSNVFLSHNELANSVNHIYSCENFIWISTKNGLCRISHSTGSKRWFTTVDGLPHNNIRQVYGDLKGRVLIATQCRAIHYIDDTGNLSVLDNSEMGFFNSILSFAEDREGNLWAGSLGSGVWKFTSDTVLNLNQERGLLSNFCYSLAITDEGDPIIGHTGGISVIDHETHNSKLLSQQEGVKSSAEFYPNAVYVDSAGHVWFGTSQGLIQYTSGNTLGEMMPPLIQLTSVQVDGQSIEFNNGPIHLKSGTYEIIVEYIGLCFSNPERVSYQTLLEGYNRQWSDLTQGRKIQFDKVSHGEYSFHIKAINENSIESELFPACVIIIKKPFYLTVWFYTLVAIVLGISFNFILRWRERNQRLLQVGLERELLNRTRELVSEKNKIEKLNKDVRSSINYAKEIQTRILSPIEQMKEVFSGAFVHYQPRDIVSGDFYWFDEIRDGLSILVCADSTGHGVPGAFISIIGISKIKEICSSGNISSPANILKRLDKEIKAILTHNVGVADLPDGMDCVIGVIDMNEQKATFASAMNPMVFYRGDEPTYFKGDRFSVGGRDFNEEKKFTDRVFEFRKKDKFYLFSDGVVDQFGGPLGKKLKSSGLKAMLHEGHSKSMDEQQEYYKTKLNEWKGELDQIDDILLMGFEF